MKMINIYEAKAQFSKLLAEVQAGQEITIAKNGHPIADLKPHTPHKPKLAFGTMAGKLRHKDEDFVGIDADIQNMFYGDGQK